MDRLDGSYIRGFTAGLRKAQEIFKYIDYDLKIHKRRFNTKTCSEMLDAAIKGRETLRENPEAFVRCTNDGKFEVYEPKNR